MIELLQESRFSQFQTIPVTLGEGSLTNISAILNYIDYTILISLPRT